MTKINKPYKKRKSYIGVRDSYEMNIHISEPEKFKVMLEKDRK